jgi:hypothetical protein
VQYSAIGSILGNVLGNMLGSVLGSVFSVYYLVRIDANIRRKIVQVTRKERGRESWKVHGLFRNQLKSFESRKVDGTFRNSREL